MAGCQAQGEFKAPKSPARLRDYWWFCLDHVRAYNASWDYYKGMSPGEIEAQLRADTGWQRPTWPLGQQGLGGFRRTAETLRDPLDLLGRAAPEGRAGAAPTELTEPLSTFGLAWPVTLAEVKQRYKELAKRHHPDANGGDRAAEERLKTINLAYATLRTHLRLQPTLPAQSGASAA